MALVLATVVTGPSLTATGASLIATTFTVVTPANDVCTPLVAACTLTSVTVQLMVRGVMLGFSDGVLKVMLRNAVS